MSEALEKEVQLHERDAQGQDWLVYPLPPGGYPLTVEKGGTGAADAATARSNLGVTLSNLGAAADDHAHALTGSDITGILPITKGGTGQTTVAAARNAMGLGNTSGAVPVANGGTGATSASGALTNLGAAASGHSHALTDSTVTGTLPITKGGTGQTTAAATRNALGLGNTTGAVPVANGGTGQTTVAAARNAFGLGNTTGAVPIANGGTGATTAAAALTALGAASAATALTVSASGNSGNHYYMRFTNGLQICYGTYSWSTTITTSLGNIYLSDTHGSFSFPAAFSSVIAAVATKHDSVANSGLYRMTSSTTGLSKIAMFRGNSASSAATQEVDYFVIGTWS